jgi:Cu-Zn family superoxide dismutase
MHRFFRRAILPATMAALALIGVAAVYADGPTYSGTAIKSVTATLADTNGKAIGVVQLHQDSTGVVQVLVEAAGLAPGSHGIHVHETGKCEGPAFASAGAHFNPDTKKQHGLSNPAGPHAGDLPNLDVAANGTAVYKQATDRISLTAGATNIFDADGTALVIHAAADDQVTDPSGNSGARIACAVVADPVPSPPKVGTGQGTTSGGIDPMALLGLGIVALAAGMATLAASRKRA